MLVSSLDALKINFDEQSLWTLNFTLALIMFGIILEISLSDFKELLKKPKPILVGVFSQFVFLPIVTFLLVYIVEPTPSIALGMFMVAACPGENVSNFITHLAKGNSALSVSLTAIATLLAIVMIPLNLKFWGNLYLPIAMILEEVAICPLKMIQLVALLLGVPLVLGITIFHNLLAFFTGFSLASTFGLSVKDKRAIAIETGIQNFGLGLLLILLF